MKWEHIEIHRGKRIQYQHNDHYEPLILKLSRYTQTMIGMCEMYNDSTHITVDNRSVTFHTLFALVSSLISFRRTLLCVLFSFIGCALAESRFLSLVVQILSSPPPFSPLSSLFFCCVFTWQVPLSGTSLSLLITLDLPFPLSFPFEWHWSMNSNHGYWPLSQWKDQLISRDGKREET